MSCDREAERVVDAALRHVLVAGEPGQDRAARPRLRTSSPPGAACSSGGRRSRPSRPPAAARRRIEGEELVEPAAVAVDDQRVPVAVRVAAALDRDVRRDRVRAPIRLAGVLERDAGLRLRAADDRDRDPDRPAFPEAGAEVGVHRVVRRRSPRRRGPSSGATGSLSTRWFQGLVGREDRARGRLRQARRPMRRRPRARPRPGRGARVVFTEAETPRWGESCPPAG